MTRTIRTPTRAEGLGASWVCWPLYAQEATRQALSLPETWDPQAMFFVGRAEERKMMKEKSTQKE